MKKEQPGPTSDSINPAHYKGDLVMRIIEWFDLGFCLGNVLKYVLRAGKKGVELEDLKKAEWYLKRRIQQVEKVIETRQSLLPDS